MLPKVYWPLALTSGFMLHAVAQSLPPGCTADNAVRAVRAHLPEVTSFCSRFSSPPYYGSGGTAFSYPYDPYYTRTITGGTTTVTAKTTVYYRSTEFSNVYRGNHYPTYEPGERKAITYTDDQPQMFAYNGDRGTPTYLTTYDFGRVYSACSCVVTQSTSSTPTPTTTVYYTRTKTVQVKPKYTYTETSEVFVPGPSPTFSVLCQLKNMEFAGLFRSVSVSRLTRTISPIPKVRYRADCCQLCADTYNCLYWKHTIATGECEYAWATDVDDRPSSYSRYDQCPNGASGAQGINRVNTTETGGSVYGLGTCSQGDGYGGEDQSEGSSKEQTCAYSPSEFNCA